MSDKQVPLGTFGSSASSVSGVGLPQLTDIQSRVLELLRKGLGVSEIVKTTNTGERNVRKHISRLIDLGFWSKSSGSSVPSSGTGTAQRAELAATGAGRYRAHGFVITLPVRSRTETYVRAMQRTNGRMRDGHKILLYPNFVKVFGQRGFGFFGVDHDDAIAQSFEYWDRFVRRIESRLNVVLLPVDGSFQMRYHCAELDNDFASDLGEKRVFLSVRGTEDGQEWLISDASFKRDEIETVHGRSSGEDMQHVVAPVMNDYRDNVAVLRKPSETWALHDEVTVQVLDLHRTVASLASQNLILSQRFESVQAQIAVQAEYQKQLQLGLTALINLTVTQQKVPEFVSSEVAARYLI